MTVSLIVPLSDPLDPIRAEHWRWLRWRWEAVLPASWEVVEGRSTADPWCKANAVESAAQAALHRTWIVVDADVLIHPQALIDAASIVQAGEAAYVHPQGQCYRMSKGATKRLVTCDPASDHHDLPLSKRDLASDSGMRQFKVPHGGGLLVVDRDAYHDAGGFDPRFVGHSLEDINLGRALRTLHGKPVELDKPLWHLWHPPALNDLGGVTARRKTPEAKALSDRYRHADGHPEAMRALVAEHQGVSP